MPDLFNSGILSLMHKSLDALWLRQKVISNNIANLDTPGYKSKSVEFEDILSSKLDFSNDDQNLDSRIQTIEPEITQDNITAVRKDGNNVDIDVQNIELVRTQIQYEYMTRMISDALSREKYVINEGRR